MKLTRRELLMAGGAGVLSTVVRPRTSHACMPGLWHPRQDAVVFWNDGIEVLVWRTLVSRIPPPGSLRAAPTPAPRGPQALAWLLAVPSAPIAYEVCAVADFEGTMSWVQSHVVEPPGSGGGSEGIGGMRGGGGLTIGPTQHVGEYDVTPIQGTGPTAATQLASWLRTNHFPAANDAAMQAYARENATFLAVRARLPASTDRADLRPLAIAFRTPTIVVPVRLSAGEAPFGLDVAVFSGRIPDPPTGASAHGLAARPLRVPGAPLGGPLVTGRVVITPYVSLAAVVRQLVSPIVSHAPQISALLTNSVAMSLVRAAPLAIDVSQPDPTFQLRDAVVPNAPGRVAIT